MTIHEDRKNLSKKTQDMMRALDSLKEEIEAIDWYIQRAEACDNEELKDILLHNAEEEKEHVAMLTEWIRKNDPEMDGNLSKYLFKVGKVEEIED